LLKPWVDDQSKEHSGAFHKSMTEINGRQDLQVLRGRGVASAGGDWVFDVYRPYDPALYARVPRAVTRLARRRRRRERISGMGRRPTPPTREAFFKAAEVVKRRRKEIADILASETGARSVRHVPADLVAATIEQAAGWMYLPKGGGTRVERPGRGTDRSSQAAGVVASFTP